MTDERLTRLSDEQRESLVSLMKGQANLWRKLAMPGLCDQADAYEALAEIVEKAGDSFE